MASGTSEQARLSAEDIALRAQWEERVHRYKAGDMSALPPEVIGLGGLRTFGRAGDGVLVFPRVRFVADLELLPPDVQFGLALANRAITAHRQQGSGRMIFAAAPATSTIAPQPEAITAIDPTRHADVLIVASISGGATSI